MNRTLLRNSLITFALLGGSLPACASHLNYLHLAGPWPNTTIGARADWTSDNGPDYVFAFGDDGLSNLTGYGNGTWNMSKPLGMQDDGFTLDWLLHSKGGGAGDTHSGGSITAPAAGDLDTSGVSSFHFNSHLGENEPGWGISTNAYMIDSFYSISNTYAYQTMYWAMDWEATVETQGTTSFSAGFEGFMGSQTLLSGTNAGPTNLSLSGSSFGSVTYYPWNSSQNFPTFTMGTYMADAAGEPGSGDINMNVRLRFSDVPIESVPEPASMLALGIGALFLLRRRQK